MGDRLPTNSEAAATASQQEHAEYYLALAEQARREMFGPRRPEWLECLEEEGAQLRIALQWFTQSAAVEQGLRLAIGLREFWNNGHEHEGYTWLTTLLALPHSDAQTALRAQALDDAGALAYNQEQWPTARSLFEESIAIRRALGLQDRLAVSLIHLGHVLLCIEHNVVAARAAYQECLDLFHAVGSRVGVAYGQLALGQLQREQGEYVMAATLLKTSLAVLRDTDEVWAIAFALNAFAHLAAAQAQPERALRLAGASAALRGALGMRSSPFWETRDRRLLEPAWRVLAASVGAAAWAEGEQWSVSQAVAYALDEQPT